MKLTRRGTVLVVAVAATLVLAGLYRSYRVIVIVGPGLVALSAAVVQLRLVDRPTVIRRLPPNGPPGETHEVELRIDATRRLTAQIEDDVDDGLTATGNDTEVIVGRGTTSTYEVDYERRGRYDLGGTRLTVTDLFGLLSQTFVYWNPQPVVVYPPVEPLPESVRTALSGLLGSAGLDSREHFEQLREFSEGDSLRDVHWKSSAKTPAQALLVAEFTGDDQQDAIWLAVQARDRRADEAATAAASIAARLLDHGYAVGLRTGDETVSPEHGREQRTAVFTQLAALEPGGAPPQHADDADVFVYTVADRSAPVVSIDGVEYAFDTACRPAQTPLAGVMTS
jgi:uncharacterized protein (DUF58 family)